MNRSSSLISQLIAEMDGTKAAALKRAEPLSEHESQGGPTEHPSKSVPDGLIPLREGSRSEENSQDVREYVESSVDENAEATSDSSATRPDLQPNMGPRQSATGEDSTVENDYEDRPKDPGTTHPANTSIGDKYSSYTPEKLASEIVIKGDRILAKIAASRSYSYGNGQPASSQEDLMKAAREGYALATALGNSMLQNYLEATVAEADYAADLTVNYLVKRADLAMMQAAGNDPDAMGQEVEPDGAADDNPGDGSQGAMADNSDGNSEAEQALEEFIAALLQHGVTPEQLMAMLQQDTGGAVMAPAGAAMPAEAAPKMAADERGQLRRVCTKADALLKSGKFVMKTPKSPKAAAIRTEMHDYVTELLGRLRV